MGQPTDRQLAYLEKIVSQIPDWQLPGPVTKAEASEQIDEAKKIWSIEHSGDTGDIY